MQVFKNYITFIFSHFVYTLRRVSFHAYSPHKSRKKSYLIINLASAIQIAQLILFPQLILC